MADRSSVSQIIQIAPEATPGTPLPATKRLQSMMITPSPKMTVQQFRPSGYKYDALAVLGKEWVEASVEGDATYDELIYPLSSILTTTTPTEGGGDSPDGSYSWNFLPATYTPDVPKTYTIEHGSSVRADRFSFGVFTEFGLEFDRESVKISGSLLGQQLDDGITLTADTDVVPLVPVIPSTLNVYADSTATASEGETPTQLTRVLSVKWTIGNRFGPIWVLDSTYDSYAGIIELVPTLTLDVSMEADAAGMAFLTTVRASATTFVRVEATGPQIGAGPGTYSFLLYMPMKIVNTGGFKDDAGLYTIDWQAVGVYDATFNDGAGGALELTIVNATATL
jgi:hypothetical protein